MRSMYKFLYDKKGRPIVTICTLASNTLETFSRGIAICSMQDIKAGTFCKKMGRTVARGRAMMALETKESACPVTTRGLKVAEDTELSRLYVTYRAFKCNKSMFDVILTKDEIDHFAALDLRIAAYRGRVYTHTIPADVRV